MHVALWDNGSKCLLQWIILPTEARISPLPIKVSVTIGACFENKAVTVCKSVTCEPRAFEYVHWLQIPTAQLHLPKLLRQRTLGFTAPMHNMNKYITIFSIVKYPRLGPSGPLRSSELELVNRGSFFGGGGGRMWLEMYRWQRDYLRAGRPGFGSRKEQFSYAPP
jgi:hypothetical protein